MKRGFTLIELLVVVLIIGILSAVALPQYTKAVEKARVSESKIILKALADAENAYMLANNGEATYDFSELDITIPTESKDWEFVLNETIGAGTFSLLASRKGHDYGILYNQGYGPEDGSFLCSASGDDEKGECKMFGSNFYYMESTNWYVVKI